MAHVATQRTPEIGIRLAMGAQPASIVTLLLGQGLRLLGIGVAICLTGALLVTRYIEAQLFGVTATDPLTFVSGCVVLAIAGLTAFVIPALRAMHVDPVIALRRTYGAAVARSEAAAAAAVLPGDVAFDGNPFNRTAPQAPLFKYWRLATVLMKVS